MSKNSTNHSKTNHSSTNRTAVQTEIAATTAVSSVVKRANARRSKSQWKLGDVDAGAGANGTACNELHVNLRLIQKGFGTCAGVRKQIIASLERLLAAARELDQE